MKQVSTIFHLKISRGTVELAQALFANEKRNLMSEPLLYLKPLIDMIMSNHQTAHTLNATHHALHAENKQMSVQI